MIATHFGNNTLPPIMVDDSMEISSEHGHHGGDEDIDIDIDFTTAPADEDYNIEDAASNSGFDGLQPQSSSAVGHDDLMIDEDQNSYIMGDGDVVLDDGDYGMEAEAAAAAMSFAMGDSSHFAVDEHSEPLPNPEAPSFVEGEIMWDEQALPKSTVDDNDLLDDSEQTFHQDVENLQHTNEHDTQENEESKPAFEHGSRATTPQNRTPPSGNPEEPRSPTTSIPGPAPISPEHLSNHTTPKSGFQAVSGDTNKPVNFLLANDSETFPAAPEVIVVYQSRGYTLFAKSESDDPDSFFLPDVSILEKPLGDFFTDIRDVIQEDLGDEDELCVSVEDLGLEIEEVSFPKSTVMQPQLTIPHQNSTLIHEASLGQIIGLHDTLLRNDDVESHRPLYMALGTRLNFSKRLASLTAAAAEGKGLSELINWDDESEEVDDSGVVDESIESKDPNLNDQENGKVLGIEAVETADGFVVESNHASPTPASVHDKQEEDEDAENSEEHQHVDVEPTPAHLSPQSNAAQDSKPSEVLPSTEKDTATSEYVEDEDDLIDYSDDEAEDPATQNRGTSKNPTDDNRTQDGNSDDLFSPCILPQTCFCNACNELLHAEYDRINEQLRRRSLTRAAEEIEQSTRLHHTDGENEQHPQTDEAVGDEYDGTAEEELDNSVQAEAEDLTAEDILGAAEPEDYNEELPAYDEPEEYQNQDLAGDSGNGLGLEEGAYVEGNELPYVGDEAELENETANLRGQEQSDFDDNVGEASISAGNLDFADAAESSVTVSADDQHYGEDDLGEYDLDDSKDTGDGHTLDNATSDGANDVQEDEIDYEDDEDEKEQSSNGISAPLSATHDSPASNGKRPRADAEVDDTSRSKGMHHLAMLRRRSA
jgi:hypothetical protein